MDRDTSALTAPVTFNSGAALYFSAVASGNWSGWSTLTRLESGSCSTTAGGGASAFGSAFIFSVQPESRILDARQSDISTTIFLRFIGSPHDPRPYSTEPRRLS